MSNTIFRIDRVATAYSAGANRTSTTLYADGCNFDKDSTSASYRSCLETGKYGGTMTTTYYVRVLAAGQTTATYLIYDFSGSSYHYNADFGGSVPNAITITAVDATSTPPTATPTVTPANTPIPPTSPALTGSVTGHAFLDTNGNGVQASGEVNLVGATVTISPAGGGAPRTATTDANGNYRIDGLPIGNVSILITGPIGTVLTAANNAQTVTIVAGQSTAATPVGFRPTPSDPEPDSALPTATVSPTVVPATSTQTLVLSPTSSPIVPGAPVVLSPQTPQDTPVSITLPAGVNGRGVWACDHGTITPAPDGTVHYVPKPGYIGQGRCATTTVAAPGVSRLPW